MHKIDTLMYLMYSVVFVNLASDHSGSFIVLKIWISKLLFLTKYHTDATWEGRGLLDNTAVCHGLHHSIRYKCVHQIYSCILITSNTVFTSALRCHYLWQITIKVVALDDNFVKKLLVSGS